MYNTAASIWKHGYTTTNHLQLVCPLHTEDIAVADNHSTGLREQSRYIASYFENSAFDVSFHHGDVKKYIWAGVTSV